MSNTTTREPTAKPDPLIAELILDYGLKSEAELKARLSEAEAWAEEHQFGLIRVISEGDSEGYEAKIGSPQSDYVHRYTIGVMAEPGALKSRARRKLIAAATALFAYSHPLLRRCVELGECEQD